MNKKEVIKELQSRYPGKNIVKNDDANPTEIICEIDPASEHSEKSVAIAVIDKTEPHYHKKTTEIYEVMKGKLTLYRDGQECILREGDKLRINPGETHSATGNETWVKVCSEPGWVLEDHILV